MKIVIAPDSFKGSLSAYEAALSIEKGIKRADEKIETIKVPMADGGEGTVQSLVDGTSGSIISLGVNGPLMQQVKAFYGILGDGSTAVIETAAASGLTLLTKEERNPMKTTTYGTGELIKDALDKGCSKIIIGIGGSATNDGGAGMVKALGVKLLDIDGNDIGYGGGSLSKLHKMDLSGMDKRLKNCQIIAACDVNNHLCGPQGASCVFGPQKGADENMIKELDYNLSHYADVIEKTMNVSIKDLPGAGAAGGLGGGLVAFLNAKLSKGIDIVMDAVKLEEKLQDADLVITGEGMIDFQTQFGKTPFGVAKVAEKHHVPVIAIAGCIGRGTEILYKKGFTSIFSIINKPMELEEAMKNGKELLQDTAENIIRLLISNGWR